MNKKEAGQFTLLFVHLCKWLVLHVGNGYFAFEKPINQTL